MAQVPHERVLLSFGTIYLSTATAKAAQLACKCSLESVQESFVNAHDPLALRVTLDLSERIRIVLTATEYHMNFLRFSLSPSTGLRSLTIEAVHLAQSSTRQLEAELKSFGPFSEECESRERRTDTCFRDIISTLEEWRQPRERRTKMVSTSNGLYFLRIKGFTNCFLGVMTG